MTNRFGVQEWSGAWGDLGTMLPLAFLLIVSNGYPVVRLFLLWGLVYIATGWYYRVPVSVQPLKVMTVVTIAKGFSIEMVSFSALLYGVIFVLLSASWVIQWLQRLFSTALVRGVQLGIALILIHKAIQLADKNGVWLGTNSTWLASNLVLIGVVAVPLFLAQINKVRASVLILLFLSIILSIALGKTGNLSRISGNGVSLTLPSFTFLRDSLIFLIIPQLPLTLGNAVYAANDACHSFWGKQARKVSPRRLGMSIGISNIAIGLLGGFPICHGSGGIGAHAQFGGKTGGATIIMGAILIGATIIPGTANLLFLIPIPVLAALLLFDSLKMASLMKKLDNKWEYVVAITVGGISLLTRNITIAFAAGFALQQIIFAVERIMTLKLKENAKQITID